MQARQNELKGERGLILGPRIARARPTTQPIKAQSSAHSCTALNDSNAIPGGIVTAHNKILVHPTNPRLATGARQDQESPGQVGGRGLQSRRGEESISVGVRPREGRIRNHISQLRDLKKGGSSDAHRTIRASFTFFFHMFILQSKKKAKTELPELEAASSATASLFSVANQVSHGIL